MTKKHEFFFPGSKELRPCNTKPNSVNVVKKHVYDSSLEKTSLKQSRDLWLSMTHFCYVKPYYFYTLQLKQNHHYQCVLCNLC